MSPIVDRFEAWGASGLTVWDCQWPGCRNIASHRTHRGLQMPWMYVCQRHLHEMRELPDQEAFAASRGRSMVRGHRAAGRWIQPTDEDWFPGGGG